MTGFNSKGEERICEGFLNDNYLGWYYGSFGYDLKSTDSGKSVSIYPYSPVSLDSIVIEVERCIRRDIRRAYLRRNIFTATTSAKIAYSGTPIL